MSDILAIDMQSIFKGFQNQDLFSDFNLQIPEGEIHAIIGPNGSGKTTLLRIITSLYEVDSGIVKKEGTHAILLENDYLYEEKTGMENIKIFGKYFGFSKEKETFIKYSDLLDLTDHLQKKVGSYSKGMKRKLSILIVTLMDVDIILLDEPTSGVDPISRVKIRELIHDMKKRKKTVIITSHELSEIEKTAEKVSMIKKGKLIFQSNIKELDGKELEELFIEEGE